MSGVNWTRRNVERRAPARRAFASSVLATPGDALEQHVPADDGRGEQEVDGLVLADDDLLTSRSDAPEELLHPALKLSFRRLARSPPAVSR